MSDPSAIDRFTEQITQPIRDSWEKSNSFVGKTGVVIFYSFYLLSMVMSLDIVVNVDDNVSCVMDSASTIDDKMFFAFLIRTGSLANAAFFFYVICFGLTRNNLVGALLFGIAVCYITSQVQMESEPAQACWAEMYQQGSMLTLAIPLLVLVMVGYDTHGNRRSDAPTSGESDPLLAVNV